MPSRKPCKVCGAVGHTPCELCGKIVHVGDWPFCPHATVRRTYGSIEPVVVFRTKDGQIRIPGSNTKRTPAGCERIEIRDIQTLAKFDRSYREQLRRESSDLRARHEEAFAEVQRINRSNLRQEIQSMHPFARAFAEHAMRRNDEKRRPNAGDFEGGFEVLHMDSSNRMKQRDASTGWKYKDV